MNLGPLDLESDALPIEPPRRPDDDEEGERVVEAMCSGKLKCVLGMLCSTTLCPCDDEEWERVVDAMCSGKTEVCAHGMVSSARYAPVMMKRV